MLSWAAAASLLALPLCGGEYVKVINGRCEEMVGILPFGHPGVNWTHDLDGQTREWCDRHDSCVGYMRYIGTNAEHCDVWCGQPQICQGTELSHDEHWVSYLKDGASIDVEDQLSQDGVSGVSPSVPDEVVCNWPYSGALLLWSQAPTEEQSFGFEGADIDPEGDICHVLVHRQGQALDLTTIGSFFHGILTDDDEIVPYFSASARSAPWLYYVDANEYIGGTVAQGWAEFGPKKHFLSIFFVSEFARCDGKEKDQWGHEEAEDVLPGHVFVDDGDPVTRRRAFNPYHFSVICGSVDEMAFVPQALVDAVSFAAHPLVPQKMHRRLRKVFFHLPDAAQPYSRIHPLMLEYYVEELYTNPEKNDAMFFKQTFLFLLQDLFRYRYRQPLRMRIEASACALCEERTRRRSLADASAVGPTQRLPGGRSMAVGIAVCVMSRRSGHLLREVIRETWATRLAGDSSIVLNFFVALGTGPIQDFGVGDVIELEAPESYKAVTLKAFCMLDWAYTAFPNLRFLVRVDDDVYLRPLPMIAQLEERPPIAYLWGNFDHGSNPVRDPTHQHYNSQEQFPERKHPLFGDIFPPYARGHLWVMSSDLLAMVVGVWREELLQHKNISMALARQLPHPDDPALGVALSNLVDEDHLSLNLDDRDLNRFALNPSCNVTYLGMHNRTWVVHHVDIAAIRCMWAIDIMAGDCVNSVDGCDGVMPDLCPCAMEVEEEVDDRFEEPFSYPKERFNE